MLSVRMRSGSFADARIHGGKEVEVVTALGAKAGTLHLRARSRLERAIELE